MLSVEVRILSALLSMLIGFVIAYIVCAARNPTIKQATTDELLEELMSRPDVRSVNIKEVDGDDRHDL